MSLADWFETFNKNLRIPDLTVNTISNRYKRITKQINMDFWLSDSLTTHSLYVGSYGRDTEIHTSDIDVIMELPFSLYYKYNSYIGNGQSNFLQIIKNSIVKTYPLTKLRADGQVIVIKFADGIVFEVIPAFINKDSSYIYPDTNNGGSWKITNPKPEIKEISEKNILWNKNLKRLCRMARVWKYNWDVPMGGLLIDTLAYNFMLNYEHKDKPYLYYDFISRDFFKYLSKQNSLQQYWLSPGANQRVKRLGNFEYKAKQCYNIALSAITYETNYPNSAKSKWREIYGTRFPI